MLQIFKKKRTKVVDETDTIVNDFIRRAIYWSYRPLSYHLDQGFLDFKSTIDEYLNELFKKDIDEGNSNTLDNLIYDMAKRAHEGLKIQRIDHLDTLNHFSTRRNSDQKAFETELTLLLQELTTTEKDLDAMKSRLQNEKFWR